MSWWKRFTPATKKDVKGINMKLSELNTALTTVNDTLTRVQAEVQALKDSLSDVDIPVELFRSSPRPERSYPIRI